MATTNKHKFLELTDLMPLVQLELATKLDEVDENASTFLGNALLKAEAAYKQFNRPVISDDSGLCVKALHEGPGVHTARYGSKEFKRMLESEERNEFLLKNMLDAKDRSASFVCCMVAYISPYRIYTVCEEVKGSITMKQAGCGGFGYDPIFQIDGLDKTMAELTQAEKGELSHRGRAAKVMNTLLASIEGVKE